MVIKIKIEKFDNGIAVRYLEGAEYSAVINEDEVAINFGSLILDDIKNYMNKQATNEVYVRMVLTDMNI